MKKTILFATAAFAASTWVAQAAIILSETFGSANVNPTATTFTPTGGVQWNYSDSAGATVNTNESRLFNPGAAGSAINSHGWISAQNAGQAFQQIQTTQTFTGLPTLSIGESYSFTLTFFAASETNNTTNDTNAYVNFVSGGNSFSFGTGSNGGAATGYDAQTLADGNAAADTVGMSFLAQGGNGGKNVPRQYTATWTSSDSLNGEGYSLVLGRTTNASGTNFVLFDDVSLNVVVVPEPSAALLGGLGVLGLLRRRRLA